MPPVSRLVLAALALITIAAPFARADAASAADRVAPVRARAHKIRIAIVGAGPAGLTAAYTLRNLGYERVTVYEKNAQAGGRVYTSTLLGYPMELGALFAIEHTDSITLGYANQYGVPYVPRTQTYRTVDDDGAVLLPVDFAVRKYGLPAALAGATAYAAVLEAYRPNEITSMAGLPPELRQPFSEFAQSKGFMPIADAIRPAFVGAGWAYYEDVPAMYLLRIMAGTLPEVLPSFEIPPATTYSFPGGFQEVFTKLAADLGSRQPGLRRRRPCRFLYNAEVTKVRRSNAASGRTRIKITANGHTRVYDRVIIATPPSAITKYLDISAEEAELFGQVESRNYHVNLAIVLGIPAERRSLFLYPNARPANVGHVNVWVQDGPAEVFRTDANVGWSQSTAQAQELLVQDFAVYGGGAVAAVLLHKEWDTSAHFGTAALENDAYERLEGLQGKKGTFYATGLMTVDTIEAVARYARDLVNAHF